MKNIIVRRFLAYLLDLFLVACVMYFITFIPLSRENQKHYEETSARMNSLYDSFRRNEITENDFNEAYIPLYYEWNRSNMGNTIINLFLIVLYFGCVPYFMNGQTIGKKLFRLRIVSVNNMESPGIVSYLVRAIILNNIFITIAQLGILSFCSVNQYYTLYANVNLVGYVLLYFIILLLLLRNDRRSLPDLIAGTKVIDLDELKALKEEKIHSEISSESHFKQPKKQSNKKKETSTKTLKDSKKSSTTKKKTSSKEATSKPKKIPNINL